MRQGARVLALFRPALLVVLPAMELSGPTPRHRHVLSRSDVQPVRRGFSGTGKLRQNPVLAETNAAPGLRLDDRLTSEIWVSLSSDAAATGACRLRLRQCRRAQSCQQLVQLAVQLPRRVHRQRDPPSVRAASVGALPAPAIWRSGVATSANGERTYYECNSTCRGRRVYCISQVRCPLGQEETHQP